MKQLDYLYFNIYNYYYQRGYYASNDIVRLQTMYIISLSAGGWILSMQALYLRLIKNSWFSNQSGAMLFAASVYLVIGSLFYHIFIVNGRDEKIFNKYGASWKSHPNKKRDLLLSFFVAIVPYIVLLSLRIFFPREH